MNPETAPCINGPKLAAWLKERDRLPASMGTGRSGDPVEMLYRYIRRWEEEGGQATVETVDKWLTFIGCHLSELPDDFYEEVRDHRRNRSRNYTPAERAEVIDFILAGHKAPEAARKFGVSVKTIWVWMSRYRKAAA